MWKWLEDLLNSGEIKKVHQVACSSGKEIAYFAKKYPAIEFTGSDLDDKVIGACRKRWSDITNLKFEVLDLSLLGEREIKELSVDVIFDSGGLQYLDEKILKDFLKKACMASRYLLLSQPLAIDFLMDKRCHSMPRGGFSWSHPYMAYMRETGWLDSEYKVYFVEENYWAKTVSIKARGKKT